jgi:hypothetical protein
MSAPSVVRSDLQFVAELLRKQVTGEEECARKAGKYLRLARDDLQSGALYSAGVAIRRAVEIRPLDVRIREAFVEIEAASRQVLYQHQTWLDLYLSARLAWADANIEAANILLAALNDLDRENAPSLSEWMDAQEFALGVKGQLVMLDSAGHLALERLRAGNTLGALTICQNYLPLAKAHPGIAAVAREGGFWSHQVAWNHKYDQLPGPGVAPYALSPLSDVAPLDWSRLPIPGPAGAREDEVADGVELAVRQLTSPQLLREFLSFLESPFEADDSERTADLRKTIRAALVIAELLEENRFVEAGQICAQFRREFPYFGAFKSLAEECEVQAAVAAWAYRDELWDGMEDVSDLDGQEQSFWQAISSYPAEPLFTRQLALIKKQQALRAAAGLSAGQKGSSRLIAIQASDTPEPSWNARNLWLAAGVFVASAIAVFSLMFAREKRPEPSTPWTVSRNQARAPAAAGELPVRIVSRVPVRISIDSTQTFPLDDKTEHKANLTPGSHLLIMANGNGSVGVLVDSAAEGNQSAPVIHANGLAAIVVNRGHLFVRRPVDGAVSVDGRALATADLERGPAIGPGHHTIQVGRDKFAIDLGRDSARTLNAFLERPGKATPAQPESVVAGTKRGASAEKVAPGSTTSGRKPLSAKNKTSNKHEQAANARTRAVRKAPIALEAKVVLPPKGKVQQLGPPPSVGGFSVPSTQPLPEQHMTVQPYVLGSGSRAEKLAKSESERVLHVLYRYSEAWRLKDRKTIGALRPGLSRRSVKEELDGVQQINMSILPTKAPRFEGNRAVVDCIHQVSQVFAGGVRKQSPDVRLTYVLGRRGNSWVIEAVH